MRTTVVCLALVVLVLPTVGIEFFHTEHSPARSDTCPACQFHQATAAIGAVAVATLPDLSFGKTVPLPAEAPNDRTLVVESPSRAPPSA